MIAKLKLLLAATSMLLLSSCAYMLDELFFHKDETQECILYENGLPYDHYYSSGGFYDRACEKCQEDLSYYETAYPSDDYHCDCHLYVEEEEETVCDGVF